MKALLVDNQTDTLPQLQKLLVNFDLDYDITTPERFNGENYSLILLSGGIWHSNNQQNIMAYKNEIEFIQTTSKPVIGICMGMLLIALAHGGKLKNIDRRTGDYPIHWNDGQISNVYENHSLALQKLPFHYHEHAKSDVCTEIIQHKTKPIIGVQFHPEISNSSSDGLAIFKTLLNALSIS